MLLPSLAVTNGMVALPSMAGGRNINHTRALWERRRQRDRPRLP
jgi:hypothetical protein